MPEYAITETPDDPSLNPLWVGQAETPLAALDAYAEGEGFATYSDLTPEDTNGEQWFYLYPEGERPYVASAIFTNTEIFVFAVPS